MPPKSASATAAAAMAGIPSPSTAVPTSLGSTQRIRSIHASKSESVTRIPPHATTPTSQSQSQSSHKTLALNSGQINSGRGGVDCNNSEVEYCEPEKIIHVEAASTLQSGDSSVDTAGAAIGVAGSGNGKRKIIRKTVRLVKRVIKKRVPKRVLTSGAENQGVAGKAEDGVNLSEVRDNLGLANDVIEKSNVVDELVDKTSVVNKAHNVLRMVDDATESLNLVNEKSDHVDKETDGSNPVNEKSDHMDKETESSDPVNEKSDHVGNLTESSNLVNEKSDHVDRLTEKTSIQVMENENIKKLASRSEQIIGKKSKDPNDITYMESDRSDSELNSIENSSEPVNDLGGMNTMETDNIESNDVVSEADDNDLTIPAPDLMEDEKVNDVSGTSMKINERENSKLENQSEDFTVEIENIDIVNKVDVELLSVQNVSPVEEKRENTIDKAESGSEVDSDRIGEGLLFSGETEVVERIRRHKTEIFVGGLHRDAQEDDIRKVFEEAGVVVEIRLMMSNAGKNRGYAFVRFATEADAKNALEKCSKAKICGKRCNVASVEGNDTIFLSSIDKNWKTEDVMMMLEKAGIERIYKVTLRADPNNIKKNRGFAFVEFETCKDAKTALNKLQRKDVFGKTQMVKAAWARQTSEPAHEEILQGTKSYNLLNQDTGVQTSKKQYEPRNQEQAARSSYNHAQVVKRSSTTDELVQILRQQASNKTILSHPRTAIDIPDHHFPLAGSKRTFSFSAHDYPLYVEHQDFSRLRVEGSHPISGPSSSSRGVGMLSFPYHHRQVPGFRSESMNERRTYPNHFQTRGRAPFYTDTNMHRR